MVELLSCPFCGSPDVSVINGPPGSYYVRCNQCLATGDDRNREAAIAVWNRRVPSPSPVAAGTEGEATRRSAMRIVRAWDAGRESMRQAVERMLDQWQASMDAAGLVSEYNQGNVLLKRLAAIAAHPTPTPGGVTEADIERVARAIAEQGFGRPWDDFLEVNAFDTDQSDLKDYALAALAASPSVNEGRT